MAKKTITQVPVTSGEIGRVAITKSERGWAVHADYDAKDDAGLVIRHDVVSWIPVAEWQTKIEDLIDNLCVARANGQERT